MMHILKENDNDGYIGICYQDLKLVFCTKELKHYFSALTEA